LSRTRRRVIRPSTVTYKTFSRLSLLAFLLSGDFVVGPVSTRGALAETLVTLLVGEDLLHLQRRDGSEDMLGVHELLVAEHLAEVGRVDPAGLLELVLRVLVFGVGHDFRKLDVIAVGVLDLRDCGLWWMSRLCEGNLALRELGMMGRCGGVQVLRLLRRSLGWSVQSLVFQLPLGRLSRIDRRNVDAISILHGLHS
jgi:hypothetical protein